MKTHKIICTIISLIIMLAFLNCDKDDSIDNQQSTNDYKIGKNRFTINIGTDEREYFVHVPQGYNPDEAIPVVFMLHGTSGNGEKFYNFSGWKELGEAENFITVYPSSWQHCIIERNGVRKNTTKWNVYQGSFTYCAGEVPRDDIGFLKEVIKELHLKFNVNKKRTYLAGFSNGGAMAFRTAVEMSDIFAAIAESSGTIQVDTLLNPKRNLPIFFQTGNSDDKFLGPNRDVPITSLDSLLTSAGLSPIMNTHINSFDLDSHFSLAISFGNPAISTADYQPIPSTDNRHLKFVLIEDLEHSYPNGINHPYKAAEEQWKWFKQFELPN